jgi:hypothetical protein
VEPVHNRIVNYTTTKRSDIKTVAFGRKIMLHRPWPPQQNAKQFDFSKKKVFAFKICFDFRVSTFF